MYYNFILFFLGYKEKATFIRSKRGVTNLIYCGYRFTKDKVFKKTTNWRCLNVSNGRYKCKARAITKVINSCEMVKLTYPEHNHLIMK